MNNYYNNFISSGNDSLTSNNKITWTTTTGDPWQDTGIRYDIQSGRVTVETPEMNELKTKVEELENKISDLEGRLEILLELLPKENQD